MEIVNKKQLNYCTIIMDFYNHGDQLLWNIQIKQRNQLLECQQLGTTNENRGSIKEKTKYRTVLFVR